MRFTERIRVDLPHPDGPISAVTLPLGTGISMLNRACLSPYQRLKSSISRMASSLPHRIVDLGGHILSVHDGLQAIGALRRFRIAVHVLFIPKWRLP